MKHEYVGAEQFKIKKKKIMNALERKKKLPWAWLVFAVVNYASQILTERLREKPLHKIMFGNFIEHPPD